MRHLHMSSELQLCVVYRVRVIIYQNCIIRYDRPCYELCSGFHEIFFAPLRSFIIPKLDINLELTLLWISWYQEVLNFMVNDRCTAENGWSIDIYWLAFDSSCWPWLDIKTRSSTSNPAVRRNASCISSYIQLLNQDAECHKWIIWIGGYCMIARIRLD